MNSSGTLISDLDSSPQIDGDGDLIKKIMADVNGGDSNTMLPPASPAPALPPPGAMGPMNSVISSPNPNSTLTHTMDSMPPTAHMIGHQHPTNADFQAAIEPRGLGGLSSMSAWTPEAPVPKRIAKVQKKSWWTRFLEEMKVPILVSLLVFLFSLPVIHIIIGSYIPSFVKPTGELTTFGLLLKALTAGLTFWVLQRVIVPLLSL